MTFDHVYLNYNKKTQTGKHNILYIEKPNILKSSIF